MCKSQVLDMQGHLCFKIIMPACLRDAQRWQKGGNKAAAGVCVLAGSGYLGQHGLACARLPIQKHTTIWTQQGAVVQLWVLQGKDDLIDLQVGLRCLVQTHQCLLGHLLDSTYNFILSHKDQGHL